MDMGMKLKLEETLEKYRGGWKDEAICAEVPAACQCDREALARQAKEDRIVVYNRVPKCGSSSLFQLAQARQEQYCRKCTFCFDLQHTHRVFPRKEAEQFLDDPYRTCTDKLRQSWKKKWPRGLVVSHQFFIPFRNEEDRRRLAYMGLVRDTPTRCRSRFFYEHDTRGRILPPAPGERPDFAAFLSNGTIGPRTIPKKLSDKKLEEMKQRIALLREECFSNYNTRWFCGMQDVCKEGGQRMLQEAKRVIAEDYAIVGVYPAITETAWLTNTLLQSNFGPPEPMSYYEEHVGCKFCASTSSTSGKRTAGAPKKAPESADPPLSREQRSFIDERNALDAELFEYARRLFAAKMHACLDSDPSPVL